MRDHLTRREHRYNPICFIAIILSIFLLFPLTSCSSSNKNGLLPALGAGRTVADQEDSEESKEPDVDTLPDRGITICVDPGHGFDDPGAPSDFLDGLAEKDITLPVSEKLIYHLESFGFTVIVTHDGNEFPTSSRDNGNQKFDPIERSAYVNEKADEIDLLVSIHCNAFDSPDVSGSKVFFNVPLNSDKTVPQVDEVLAAESIRDSIEEAFPDATKPTCDMGDFQMVRDTRMDSVLVEIGFLTNEDDAAKMLDEEWRDQMAEAIAKGIDKFFTESEE